MSEQKPFELTSPMAIVLAGVIIAGAIVFTNSQKGNEAGAAGPAGPTISAASIRPPSVNDHIIGSPTAPIVLVEYSDFQCPFCEIIHSTLKKVVADSNGQIAWVYRHLPLNSIHPQANPAANASECIAAQLGSAGFWNYADAVFAEQSKLSTTFSSQLAERLGVDMQKYAQCMNASTYQKVIDTDAAEAESAGGTGTPFVIVLNTKSGKAAPISGALPYAQIMSVIKSVQ